MSKPSRAVLLHPQVFVVGGVGEFKSRRLRSPAPNTYRNIPGGKWHPTPARNHIEFDGWLAFSRCEFDLTVRKFTVVDLRFEDDLFWFPSL